MLKVNRARGRLLLVALVVLLAAGALALVLSTREDATPVTAAGPGQEVPAQDGQDGEVLRQGNVLLVAGRGRVAEARRLAEQLAGGPGSPELRAAGQAVLVRPGPGRGGIVAVAYRHQLRAETAADPALAAFVEHWLGRGG